MPYGVGLTTMAPLRNRFRTRTAARGIVPAAGMAGGRPGLPLLGRIPGVVQGGAAGSLATAYQTARTANERRYEEILGGYRERYQRAVGQLGELGAQQEADIRMTGRSREAGVLQENISRGVTGTTVLPTMRAGVQRQTRAELGRLREQLAGLRLQYETQLSGQELQFMERREDAYPNVGGYLNMLQQAGRYTGPATATATPTTVRPRPTVTPARRPTIARRPTLKRPPTPTLRPLTREQKIENALRQPEPTRSILLKRYGYVIPGPPGEGRYARLYGGPAGEAL